MASTPSPKEETYRRMPTLELIEDEFTRHMTAQLTHNAPDYFWEKPATTNPDFHHPAASEEHGLWAHTLMLSTVIHRLSDSYIERGLLTEQQIDHAHAAAILHDQRKFGDRENPEYTSASDHDIRMAEVVRDTDLPGEIADAIECHNGPWYDGAVPKTPLERLVHTADMIASEPTIDPAVQGPLPEELEGLDLEVVDLK